MVTKDELLKMLDEAVEQEEVLITSWRDAVILNLPNSDLTEGQKAQLKKIVDTQTTQSLKHKEILSNWVNKVIGSGVDEF